jgi:hypothetical protein
MQPSTMLQCESYTEHEQHLPSSGRFIIAQFDDKSVIVYQAFNATIADYAVQNQRFGGPEYDFERMTWIKPSFLWMMYYSGWARRENQENVLAIRLSRAGFDSLLRTAVHVPVPAGSHPGKPNPSAPAQGPDVQLQWIPYHDLKGNKTDRRAARIGLSGESLKRFNEEWILNIENITPYVRQQQQLVLAEDEAALALPRERVYAPDDLTILNRIEATTISL